MASPPILFPPPPPTSNLLTARQKAHLRRSTNKLTKVLGTTPLLVDTYPSISRDVASPPPYTPSTPRPAQGGHTTPRRTHTRSRTLGERFDPDSYPLSSAVPPTPRASRARAASVSAGPDSPSSPPPALAVSRAPPHSRDSMRDSLYDPSFTIPTAAAARRAKMARVARRLGDGVPAALVFHGLASAADGDDSDGDGDDGASSDAFSRSTSRASTSSAADSVSSSASDVHSAESHASAFSRLRHAFGRRHT